MRVVVQRCKYASCRVNGEITGEIQKGFLCLVGFSNTDNLDDVAILAKKTVGLRIFEDENLKMNKSLAEVGGEILSISQFTLYADCRHGNRPSFTSAMEYQKAKEYYDAYCKALEQNNINVYRGVFGADMKIELLNDGPVTILLDSQDLK